MAADCVADTRSAPIPAGKRPPPYFQCYASDWIAAEDYALMSLAERGLLLSMLNAAWVNSSVPSNPKNLARVLQATEGEVAMTLTDRVLRQFRTSSDDPERLICPELERQRLELEERRRTLSEAGRKGGMSTQARARSPALSQASSLAKATEMRCDEMNRDEVKSDESIEKGNWPEEHKEWGEEYDRAIAVLK